MRDRRRLMARCGGVALVFTLGSGAAACGIPTDDQPRAISPSSSASSGADAPSTVDPNSVNSVEETVYLIEGSAADSATGERLAPQIVHVANTTDGAEMVKSTLEKLITIQSAKGLTNAVPSGTKILSTRLSADGNEVTIDLSDEFNDVQQSLQRRAFAQLVFSATGVTPTNIRRVRFLIDGEPKAAATDNEVPPSAGDTVSRSDYPSFESTMASTTTDLGTG